MLLVIQRMQCLFNIMWDACEVETIIPALLLVQYRELTQKESHAQVTEYTLLKQQVLLLQ